MTNAAADSDSVRARILQLRVSRISIRTGPGLMPVKALRDSVGKQTIFFPSNGGSESSFNVSPGPANTGCCPAVTNGSADGRASHFHGLFCDETCETPKKSIR